MRDRLLQLVKEFAAILTPLEDSRILYLGTPQTEETLYRKLEERGYVTTVYSRPKFRLSRACIAGTLRRTCSQDD
jgi:hypothetical protein